MKKRLLVMSVVLTVALVFAGTAFSKGKAGNMMGMGMGMNKSAGMLLNDPTFIDEIGLTDVQVEKLTTIRTKMMKQHIRSRADVEILQLDLEELVDQDKPDLKKIDSLIEQIGAKQTEMQKQSIHSMIEMKSILTDEQLEKVKQLIVTKMKERKGNRSDRGGHRQGMGMGMRFQPEEMESPEK